MADETVEVSASELKARTVAFAIKAEVRDPAETFAFAAPKTMYGGKHIAAGDTVFVFASENEGGRGLVARGSVPALPEQHHRSFSNLHWRLGR